jgi:hypothetical protein
MLFDIHTDPVDEKKVNKPRAKPAAPAAAGVPEFRPVLPCLALGQIDDVFECACDGCCATLHEIIDEFHGKWRIACMFCGTGQVVPAIKGHLKPKTDEFTFASGDYAGMTISAVAADRRGLAYVEWAAEEHKIQSAKDACKTFLDNRKTPS